MVGRVRSGWWVTAVLTVVLAGFGLRLFRLGYQSLWVDEATSAYLSTLTPAQIVLNRANNLHPPTYFLALAGWTALVGRSEFSLRYLSAWLGLLFVPLSYRLGRRLFCDRMAGLMAALLAALNPAAVVYSQEARMYAAMPVAYLLVLTCALIPGKLRDWRGWFRLAVAQIVCLYLHFFSIFVVLAVNLLLLAIQLRHACRRTWWQWGVSQGAVLLSYMPWLLAMACWGSEVPARLSRRDWRATGMDPSHFFRLIWGFLSTGAVGIRKIGNVGLALGLLGVLIGLAFLLALRCDRRRRELLGVAGAFILPLLAAYPVWYMRPLAHPRYLLLLLAPLVILLARICAVLVRRRWLWAVGVALLAMLVGVDGVALGYALLDKRFFRHDMRALAETIRERAAPGEAVLLPPDDYSLWYYDPAPADPVNLPGEVGAEGGRLRLEELGTLLAGRPGAFLVTYHDLRAVDPRGQVPFLLETNGRLVEQFSVDRMDVDHYELEGSWTLPELTPVAVPWGPLMLTGVFSQAVASADNAVTVALRWRLEQPSEVKYRAAVRLWDGDREVAGADASLLNEQGRPTSYWGKGEEATNYYVLPLPMGTPPLTYTLSVQVYASRSGQPLAWSAGEEWFVLGPVRLSRAVGQTSDPYGSWSGTDWRAPLVPQVADGLLLEGYALRPETLKPGDTLHVTLRWRATRDSPAHFAPCLLLRQEDAVLAQDCGTLFERYPTERWAAGELLIETRPLPVPPTLAPLQLALAVGGGTVPLGEVAVARDALEWTVPTAARPACARLDGVAELAGYEWEPIADRSGAWRLTLYWRGLADPPPAESYTVFTHLLSPEGVLLAQHDGPPAEGRRPTSTWLPGEVIADRHELSPSGPYAGPARLLIGMYDLATMTRLPAYDCAGQRLPGDAVLLAEIVIGEAP